MLREKVRNYLLENTDELLDITREMNSYDGSFEFVDAWDFEELCSIAADGGGEAVERLVWAAVNGDTAGGMVRYDAYGNLKPGEESDLIEDCIDEIDYIIDKLEDYTNSLSDELKELVEAEYDVEEIKEIVCPGCEGEECPYYEVNLEGKGICNMLQDEGDLPFDECEEFWGMEQDECEGYIIYK